MRESARGAAAVVLAWAALAVAGSPRPAAAEGVEADAKAPSPASSGKRYAWKAQDGLAYEYFVPKEYDAKAGANLTLILHGSNLTRHWGFANHAAGKFRPDDVVVCPDGTTPNGQGGFNFLQSDKDLKRLHALHEELKKTFRVRATFVYGHSQGSFFSFLYAGAFPDDVQGVLGQASGVWIGTQATERHHHQAIALLHGTADPVVPYGQSVGGLDFYREAKYPLAHLRSLEGWNHWPTADQAEQELAWCEGTTSADPARVVACFETLSSGEGPRDFAALRAVASRLAELEGAPAAARSKASAAVEAVDALAKRHVEAMARSLGKEKGDKLADDAWVAHVRLFLRDFDGVPVCDDLAKAWADRRKDHRDGAVKHLREYYRVRQKDAAKAFDEGVEAIRTGFLWYECADPELWKALDGWKDDAKRLKLTKAALKAYDGVVPVMRSACKKGLASYVEVNETWK
jgi:predicted esterase